MRKIVEMTPIPILKPLLPKTESYLRYLKEIDYNRWYSNFGPLVVLFEERFLERLSPGLSCTTVSNGTLALMLALKALAGEKKGYVLLPSWTFPATAQAVVAAGFSPYFLDVETESWMISPEGVQEVLKKVPGQVVAVMPVIPFGASFQAEKWDGFTDETGIPVVIDAATACEDGGATKTPVMISLHATKLLGIGEGAVLLSSDKKLIHDIRTMTTFGFPGKRTVCSYGINAKMSEFMAAVGLGMLDELPHALAAWESRAACYRSAFSRIKGASLQEGFGETWVGSVLNILLEEPQADFLMELLWRKGIETRQWWGKGCHKEPFFSKMPGKDLVVTEWLGERVFGIPFYRDLREDQILYICETLAEILGQERALAS